MYLRAINPHGSSELIFKQKSRVIIPALRTHCGEFVRWDFLLALCDGVEEQVLQTRQDARLPSPAGQKKIQTEK